MKQYFSSLLAILTVIVIFFVFLFILIAAALSTDEISVPRGSFLEISLQGELPFFEQKREVDELLGKSQKLSLQDIVLSLKNAQYDDRILGVLLKINFFSASFGNLEELKSAIESFKEESGKRVYAYIESAGNREYFLAESADSIFMQPEGMLSITPLQMNRDYYAESLNHVGIKADFIPIGKYKSAPETFTQRKMSENSRKQSTELLRYFQNLFYEDIKKNRSLSDADFEAILDQSWFSSYQAEKLRLLDKVLHSDELKEKLKGNRAKYRYISIKNYRDIPLNYTVDRNNKIAIINADGAIFSGNDGTNPMTGKTMGADRVIRNIRSALKNKRVKGIILRLNSPGGSVLPSDELWREITLAKKKKPIFASVGGVAASGAYYIAMACDTIIAQSASIVGSIGVFMGKFDLSGFRKDWLKINNDRILLDEKRDFNYFNLNRSFTSSERRILQGNLEAFYKRFVSKVARARSMSFKEANERSQGRVWTGKRGKEIALVDQIGNFQTAIDLMKRKLDLDKEPALTVYPKTVSLFEDLNDSPLIFSQWDTMESFVTNLKSMAQTRQWAILPFQLSID